MSEKKSKNKWLAGASAVLLSAAILVGGYFAFRGDAPNKPGTEAVDAGNPEDLTGGTPAMPGDYSDDDTPSATLTSSNTEDKTSTPESPNSGSMREIAGVSVDVSEILQVIPTAEIQDQLIKKLEIQCEQDITEHTSGAVIEIKILQVKTQHFENSVKRGPDGKPVEGGPVDSGTVQYEISFTDKKATTAWVVYNPSEQY